MAVSSRRFLIVATLLGLLLVFDAVLFGWLLWRSLSERELERLLFVERQSIEPLAAQLAEQLKASGDDLFVAVARTEETRTYVESVLRQRNLVRTVEIRDAQGNLVLRKGEDVVIRAPGQPALPEDGALLESGGLETPVSVERTESEETFDVVDLTVPIEDLGQIRLGLSREQLQRQVEVLQSDLRERVAWLGGVTLAILLIGYSVVWWLWRRGQRLEEQAAESERLAYLGTLAAGLAHEIRNPLNSLSLNVQMLEEEIGLPRAGHGHRLMDITRTEIKRLENLVNDFLAYARPRPLDREPTPPAELFRRLSQVLGPELEQAGVALLIDASAKPGPQVLVDGDQIVQLLLNLARNALQAMEGVAEPRLLLRARSGPEYLRLEVVDNGRGIPEAALSRVFEIFFSTQKGGTGLGLAIAERIARDHGGRIELSSREGEGTVASVLLPLAPRQEQAQVA